MIPASASSRAFTRMWLPCDAAVCSAILPNSLRWFSKGAQSGQRVSARACSAFLSTCLLDPEKAKKCKAELPAPFWQFLGAMARMFASTLAVFNISSARWKCLSLMSLCSSVNSSTCELFNPQSIFSARNRDPQPRMKLHNSESRFRRRRSQRTLRIANSNYRLSVWGFGFSTNFGFWNLGKMHFQFELF